MITDGFLYLGVLLGLAAVIVYVTQRRQYRFLKYVPGFVLLYLGAALLNTVGVFGESDSVDATGDAVKDALLPAMILLLLFKCDIRKIIKLGPKLLLTFVISALSIAVGFVIAFLIFQATLEGEAYKALGALAASWTGGSANLVAVQSIVDAPETLIGYVLIVDTVLYSLWLLVMFSSVGVADRFNQWAKAKAINFDGHAADEQERSIDLTSLMTLIGFSLLVSALATWVGGLLPELGDVVTGTTWTILIVSVLGLVIASTRFGRTAGSSELAMVMLYVIIGIIASGSDFSSLAEAPLYLLIGVIALIVHATVMVVYAKLTKSELASLAVASTANLGGMASAPVVASAFHRQMVPVGVLFALIGAFSGTFVGLATVNVLGVI
ncbi:MULTISPECIES: DUF819 family protein [Prauserella salsuginis group]|uniref:DUF819 domain-containing protein n=1 Tax=Prauserella salsuginis TaxID=387889 RepID=A0ABW6GCE5_9PSEU|nr:MULTISPECIES: DUF819 family protein [Prauserella salsuginis group]MCR3722479.1 putative membrane protein [Prauserella flava]MCR3736921.1 putative membrane protein [Prauserella salsuginis]